MAGRPYYGYGPPPPGGPHHYGPPPPGGPHHGPPPPAGFIFYPIHPGYFYPPGEAVTAAPEPVEDVQVAELPADSEPMVPTLPGEVVELPYSSYRWVPACVSQFSIPPGALEVGVDQDGHKIYAGRAHHGGDIVPAKVIPTKNACYISYNGEEIAVDQYEVLVPAMFSWQFSKDGEVPPGAIKAGVTSDGEDLYFGRVTLDGHTTPGKIHPSHGNCYYPFNGEEKCSAEYEVLVLL